MTGGKGDKGSSTGRVAKNWGSKDYCKSEMKEVGSADTAASKQPSRITR